MNGAGREESSKYLEQLSRKSGKYVSKILAAIQKMHCGRKQLQNESTSVVYKFADVITSPLTVILSLPYSVYLSVTNQGN